MVWKKVFLAIILLIGDEYDAYEAPVVDTPLGTVRGFTMTSRSGRVFNAFQGIPYAKPPLGELRFKAPQPSDAWSGIMDAMGMPSCLQSDYDNPQNKEPIGNEDCLYLAVYTHNISKIVPVLFYIHGGAFTNGNSPKHGPHYLMDEDVVIVGIHYRLNVFGFLSFENNDLPGNQGMKDQVMAMKWVQKNVHLFGGNPEDVTIMGESAGGASVYHHLVSPMSKGLYHKAISESGTNYAFWALPPPGVAKSSAEKVAASLRCPTNPVDAVACLQKKDAKELIVKALRIPHLNLAPVFEKNKEDAFLVGPIRSWKHNPVPLIIGMTSAEGLMFTIDNLRSENSTKAFFKGFTKHAEEYIGVSRTASDPSGITKQVFQYYNLDKDLTLESFINITAVVTDVWFSVPILDGIVTHKGPVYAYYFDYVGPELIPDWLEDKHLYFGASHVAERDYIWNITMHSFPKLSEETKDYKLSKQLVKMVVNFAKYGNPTPAGGQFTWEKWTVGNNFLYIDREAQLTTKKFVLTERYNFWKILNYRDLYDSGAQSLHLMFWIPSICLFAFAYVYLKQ